MKQRIVLLVMAALLGLSAPTFAQLEPNELPNTYTPPPTAFDDPALVQTYQATITPEDLAAHLYFFASDFFEGRETTTRGQKLAAHYLASQYQKLGLQPRGTTDVDHIADPRAFFQPIPLNETKFEVSSLSVTVDGEPVAATEFSQTAYDGRSYLARGQAGDTTGGVVFAGYGIASNELGYNDYEALNQAEIDLTGKWLLVLRDEPLASADESLLNTEDGGPSQWTQDWWRKPYGAAQRGALGVLVVGDVGPQAPDVFADAVSYQAASHDGVGNLSLSDTPERRGNTMPPLYHISSELADRMLAPSGQTVAELQATINETLTPIVFDVEDTQVQSTITYQTQPVESENVIAFLEGGDPELKHEVVVVTSHYDHVGMNPQAEGDGIYNGADDDGSGTVSVIEIAEAFTKAAEDGYRPRRSLLFMNVSGEEKGLLGSSYFADVEPVVPLESIVANLNIDMIGRFDPTHPTRSENYVYIIGSNLISQELHDINQRVNEITGTTLELDERFNSKDDPNQFYRRSDHWNFGKHNIPFIFFFTGTHEDYHQPGDEAEKIEYDRMARIARLIFATTWQVANQDTPPAVTGTGFN